MTHISSLINIKREEKKKGDPRSERDNLLDKFLEEINPSRIQAGYKPYTHPRLAKMLKGYDEQMMYALYKECEKGRSFGAMFNHIIKSKKV